MLAPSQGIHLVLDKSFLPGESAVIGAEDRVTACPFRDPLARSRAHRTTDTPVSEAPTRNASVARRNRVPAHARRRYLTKDPSRAMFERLRGLRPLRKMGEMKDTASLPRDHSVSISKSGLVTISGGKWTTLP